MAGQLAIDFNRHRYRALTVEGSARSPRVRGFVAHDLPDPESEVPEEIGAVLAEGLRAAKVPRDPAAMALDSYYCTFREMDLPFTQDEQIDKVLKFEAESHLHLVDIDEVVVDYRRLSESRDGSHLLVMAYEKDVIQRRLAALSKASVDPHFADLHINSLFSALEYCGYFLPSESEEEESEDGEESQPAGPSPSLHLVLECDHDVTHLLVVHEGELRAARAIRLGIVPPVGSEDEEELGPEEDTFVLEMDEDGAERVGGLPAEQFFSRLHREVQRTLFPLGLAEVPARFLVLGPVVRDARFLERLEAAFGQSIEVPRVFDGLDHRLDEDELALANAEGVAALGVALRLLGTLGGTVDLRQEEVRYARRFDQIKVALSCAVLMAAIVAFLFALEDLKSFINRREELNAAATLAIERHREFVADNSLERRWAAQEIDAVKATEEAWRGLRKKRVELANLVGGDGTIPRPPSGLVALNEVLGCVGGMIDEIGRTQLSRVVVDLEKDRPYVQVEGLLLDFSRLDRLKNALSELDIVERVQEEGTFETQTDGRVKFRYLVQLKQDAWRAYPKG